MSLKQVYLLIYIISISISVDPLISFLYENQYLLGADETAIDKYYVNSNLILQHLMDKNVKFSIYDNNLINQTTSSALSDRLNSYDYNLCAGLS
jgi:hypothetical protein